MSTSFGKNVTLKATAKRAVQYIANSVISEMSHYELCNHYYCNQY